MANDTKSSPSHLADSFVCPHCNVYSKQNWYAILGGLPKKYDGQGLVLDKFEPFRGDLWVSECDHCGEYDFWAGEILKSPSGSSGPRPNEDMPEDVKADFEEARKIVSLSPRGAAALLRLAVQKLCKHLGGSGDNINADIAILVKHDLPERIQKALDTVRVVGNSAVHPGQIDLIDDEETAHKLFDLINLIVDYMISKPKAIDDLFDKKVPDNLKDAIKKRDGK